MFQPFCYIWPHWVQSWFFWELCLWTLSTKIRCKWSKKLILSSYCTCSGDNCLLNVCVWWRQFALYSMNFMFGLYFQSKIIIAGFCMGFIDLWAIISVLLHFYHWISMIIHLDCSRNNTMHIAPYTSQQHRTPQQKLVSEIILLICVNLQYILGRRNSKHDQINHY